MITQNPEDIDDDILKQTNTNIFLGLREEVITKVPSIPAATNKTSNNTAKAKPPSKPPTSKPSKSPASPTA
ncbi:hypothetical protein [Halorussus sp. AFM4]|uniref:hypothetical protein n=1 Tax=Halorussus sp. AFM4 TaxID=3421651 RepID=UPI003EBEE670